MCHSASVYGSNIFFIFGKNIILSGSLLVVPHTYLFVKINNNKFTRDNWEQLVQHNQ